MSKIEEIRQRWADCKWPKIGYFVHGQAREDIAVLLGEVGRLRCALSTISSQREEAMRTQPDSGVWAKRVADEAMATTQSSDRPATSRHLIALPTKLSQAMLDAGEEVLNRSGYLEHPDGSGVDILAAQVFRAMLRAAQNE